MYKRKHRGIKKTFKILGFSIAAFLILLVTTVILLQNSKIQNLISDSVVKNLSETLNTKVEVGGVHYKLFSTISIKNLYLEDLRQDTLLFVHELDMRFNLVNFLRGKFVIKSVGLNNLNGNLIIDKDGVSNLDFVIKAFSNTDAKKKASDPLEFNIKRLTLKNSSFALTNNRTTNKPATRHMFNPNQLRIRDINTDISFEFYNKDSADLFIKSFAANEQLSGFSITGLEAEISTSSSGMLIPVLKLELPQSTVNFDPIIIGYDSIVDMRHFDEKVRVTIPIAASHIALSDLAAFVPNFKSAKGGVSLSAELSGQISNLKLQNLKLNYGKDFVLEASLELNGLPNIDETFVYGNIANLRINKNEAQDIVSALNGKPFLLPKELNELGTVQYKGNATGFFSNLVIFGNLTTNIGSLATDIQLQFSNNLIDFAYNGTLKSNSISLGQLINNTDLGNIAFSVNTKGEKKGNDYLEGIVKANVYELNFKEYAYKDINFDGTYSGNGFDGQIILEDENVNAKFNGIINMTKGIPVFDFELSVEQLDLHALKLIETYPNTSLSFKASTNMVGNSLDNVNGYLRLDRLQFTNQNKTLNVDSVLLVSTIADGNTNFSITSDYVNGTFKGQFLYSTIGTGINSILAKYLPAIGNTPVNKLTAKQGNQMEIDLNVKNFNDITDVLNLPCSLQGISTIKGFINETDNKVNVSANFPGLSLNKQRVENLSVVLSNINRKELELTCRTQYLNKKTLINFFVNAGVSNNLLSTHFGWQNTQEVTNAGNIRTQTRFTKTNGQVAAHLDIQPTNVIISDSVWHVHQGSLNWDADNSIRVNNFRIDSDRQFIHIDGTASKSRNDSLYVSINKLNIDFIMDLVELKGLKIGGNASGEATVFSVFDRPIYEANLQVTDFKLNNKHIGRGDVFSTWDKENKQVYAKGTFFNNKNDTIAFADGIYIPETDSLNILFDAHDLSVEFLSPYFEEVAENVQGLATGKVRLLGPSKRLCFEGDAFIRKGQATVSLLKTTYTFEDYIYLKRRSLEIKNLRLYDLEGNQAIANGRIDHTGLFEKMDYDFSISTKNILALNTQSNDNEYFFGKAYADGTVRIYGDMAETNILVNVTSRPHSKVFIRMASMSTASDNSFIKFVDNDRRSYIVKKQDTKAEKSSVNVKVNLQVDVTPEAEIELIIDPKAGDRITAKGNGSLRMEFDTNSDIRLFGTYTIENGHYLFTFQNNLIQKEFRIERGSNISWTGSMTNANVNIRAIYAIKNASLRDLMDRTQMPSRSNIPVNCVLILTENLMSPTIEFNIDLPSSDESIKQQVRSIISTEEMMNRQIFSLLLLGRFYTPEYMGSTTANGNDGIAFATATLNGWLSKLTQDSKFTLGFDIHSDEQTAQYQTEIQYRPNNRFIINGNIGYQEDDLSDRNRFIGDWEIEYLLTESEKLRFKAYSHTVDRTGMAKTSYGGGLLYKEEFRTVKEMINYYWQLFNFWKKGNNSSKEQE